MQDEIIEVYEKEDDILKFTKELTKFSFENLPKTNHFYYSLDEKATDIEILRENFNKFEKIKLINKRKHKNNNITYDFYYELDDGTYILYCIALENKPMLLNAFHVSRNFRQFKKNLIKSYKRQLIG